MKNSDLINAPSDLGNGTYSNFGSMSSGGSMLGGITPAQQAIIDQQVAQTSAAALEEEGRLQSIAGLSRNTATMPQTFFASAQSDADFSQRQPPILPPTDTSGAADLSGRSTSGTVLRDTPNTTDKSKGAKEGDDEAFTTEEDTTTEDGSDKILGMPKGIAIGLGITIVAIGGFLIYKKFKK